jgi:hypothetical protein
MMVETVAKIQNWLEMVSAMMKVTYKSAIMMKETVVSINMFVLAVVVTAKILNLLAINFAIMKRTMLSVIMIMGSVVDLTYPVRDIVFLWHICLFTWQISGVTFNTKVIFIP